MLRSATARMLPPRPPSPPSGPPRGTYFSRRQHPRGGRPQHQHADRLPLRAHPSRQARRKRPWRRQIRTRLRRHHAARAGRHAQRDVVGAASVFVGAMAVFAALGAMDARVAVVDQRVDVAVGHREDTAAATAVTTVGAAARHILFAAERDDAVAAVARMHFDDRFVDELHWPSFMYSAKCSVSSPRRWPSHTECQPGSLSGNWRPYWTSSMLHCAAFGVPSAIVVSPVK